MGSLCEKEKHSEVVEITKMFPHTEIEKKAMKKPYIVKPCPLMYTSIYLECNFKSENNTATVHAASQKPNPSATVHTSVQISLPLNS